MVRPVRAIASVVVGLLLSSTEAMAHPVHMTLTEVRPAGANGRIEIMVKVFTDDFSTAAARYTKSHLDSGRAIDRRRGLAYLLSRLRLANRNSAIPLTPCGVTISGDALIFCLHATSTGSPTGLRVSNTLMTELFDDQVNVVQAVVGKRRTSRMFVRGDGWKSVM
jgi:hypothetical protein